MSHILTTAHEAVVPSARKSSRPLAASTSGEDREWYRALGRRLIEAWPENLTPLEMAERSRMSIADFGAVLVGEYRLSSLDIVQLAEAFQVSSQYLLTGEQAIVHVCAGRESRS